MSIESFVTTLEVGNLKGNALFMIPKENIKPLVGVFSHGMTSHKASILSWATRLVQEGFPVAIFDLPGHLLGGLHQVEDAEEFKSRSSEFFFAAFQQLAARIPHDKPKVVIGGHSLGALFSLKALKDFQDFERAALAVGLGISPSSTHVFESSLFEKTMEIRNALVSSAIHTKIIFPWIAEQKESLEIKGERIHLVTGEDDIVVGKKGMEELEEKLREGQNTVSFLKPKKLSHHQPELASRYVLEFVQTFLEE